MRSADTQVRVADLIWEEQDGVAVVRMWNGAIEHMSVAEWLQLDADQSAL